MLDKKKFRRFDSSVPGVFHAQKWRGTRPSRGHHGGKTGILPGLAGHLPGAAVGLPGQGPGLPRADNRPRRERYLTTRTRLARLPFQRTLEQFGFSLQASIDERLVRELANRPSSPKPPTSGGWDRPAWARRPWPGHCP